MKKKVFKFLSSVYQRLLFASQKSGREKIQKVRARVISIGNITWGGTGKTPLVAKIAQEVSRSGKKAAVLTRGYAGGDEAEELRKKLPDVPVIVGRDRVKSAEEAIQKHGAEVLILDDGFQHIRLHRDLDIVTINATEPFGVGGLIPSGNLREPVEHLSRADIFVLTKSDIGQKNLHWISQKLLEYKPQAVIFEAVHKPVAVWSATSDRRHSPDALRGRRVSALSGLADPHSFEKTVENLGAEIVFAGRFDDHHAYTRAEIDDFLKRSRAVGAAEVVTTRKDFVRLEPFFRRGVPAAWKGFEFWVLDIEIQLSDEDDLVRRCLVP